MRGLRLHDDVAKKDKRNPFSADQLREISDAPLYTGFYHSICTHSVPWAFHGKAAAKADRKPKSEAIFMNRLDAVLCSGQDGQTIGIPVGPDASRYVAELVGTAIDLEFLARGGAENCEAIRHVDDVWIGAHTHADEVLVDGKERPGRAMPSRPFPKFPSGTPEGPAVLT